MLPMVNPEPWLCPVSDHENTGPTGRAHSPPLFLPPGCESAHPDGIIDRRFAEPTGFAGTAGEHCAHGNEPAARPAT
jgi:hypothetical protein